VLEWVRAAASHPTAAQVHEALLCELPTLSRGTVYRNLEVLVADGLLEALPGTGGAVRYDGNPEPHHHFTCEACGDIRDLDLPAPPGLARRLRREYGLLPQRTRIEFYGSCPDCSDEP
jgi:Fur family ferric uptake transcriptional regulator/Fur family peroxide stress response transcriptional regulator